MFSKYVFPLILVLSSYNLGSAIEAKYGEANQKLKENFELTDKLIKKYNECIKDKNADIERVEALVRQVKNECSTTI